MTLVFKGFNKAFNPDLLTYIWAVGPYSTLTPNNKIYLTKNTLDVEAL
jgi:hypothetical protein